MVHVGDDYKKMMSSRAQYEMTSGVLEKEIDRIAKAHGINMSDKVECEIDDYHTLNCF